MLNILIVIYSHKPIGCVTSKITNGPMIDIYQHIAIGIYSSTQYISTSKNKCKLWPQDGQLISHWNINKKEHPTANN